jgi:outer membrane protein assembly factor BamA
MGWLYLDLSAAASTKAYTGVDARVRWLQTSSTISSGLEVWTDLRYRNNTQDDFYGLGDGSTNAGRVDFGITTTDLVARVIEHVRPGLTLGGNVGYLMPDVRRGRDDNLRSIDTVYTDATAPGLAQQPNFLHEDAFVEIDGRDAHGFPTRGGLYRAAFAHWDDRTFNQFDFNRLDIEGSQFFGLTKLDVVAVRLRLAYANNSPGDRIPFYMLPYIGGGDTDRGYREFRFRDENAGLFSAEYRHRVHPMAYLAGFVDVGKVAHDWQDIVPTHTKPAYGVGLRLGSDKSVFARLDVAHADEGTRIFLKFSAAF